MRSPRTPKVYEAATLAGVMEDLTRQGFTAQFMPVDWRPGTDSGTLIGRSWR